jgi:hypothetical protein
MAEDAHEGEETASEDPAEGVMTPHGRRAGALPPELRRLSSGREQMARRAARNLERLQRRPAELRRRWWLTW